MHLRQVQQILELTIPFTPARAAPIVRFTRNWRMLSCLSFPAPVHQHPHHGGPTMKVISSMLLGMSLALASASISAAQDPASAPPKVIQLTREWIKPGKSGMAHDR